MWEENIGKFAVAIGNPEGENELGVEYKWFVNDWMALAHGLERRYLHGRIILLILRGVVFERFESYAVGN